MEPQDSYKYRVSSLTRINTILSIPQLKILLKEFMVHASTFINLLFLFSSGKCGFCHTWWNQMDATFLVHRLLYCN